MEKTFNILIVFILLSCQENSKLDLYSFESIEVSYEYGWVDGATTHISKLGSIQQCEYKIIDRIKSSECYTDTLNSILMDTLLSKIDKLQTERIDSIYDISCEDCGAYYVKIQYADTTIRTTINVGGNFKNEITSLAKFVADIKIDQYPIDSMLIFETTRIMISPKMPEHFKDSIILIPKDN